MNRLQRHLLWWSTALTFLTGVVYGWMKYVLEPMDEWAVINHPLQPLVLKLHIVVAPAMVFAVGMVALSHIWPLWRSGLPRGRGTGVWTASIFGPLVLSGSLIQAVTAPAWLTVVTWTHVTLGILCGGLFLGHRVVVRRGIRRRKGSLNVIRDAGPGSSARSPDSRAGRRESASLQEPVSRRVPEPTTSSPGLRTTKPTARPAASNSNS